MTSPAISVQNLSKCYNLGTIGRHTLVDEVQYWWHKARGRDPREYFSKVGHTATEARKVMAERKGSEQFWALKDVSFDVAPGTVVGIIGRNGAGKSTLLKILTRITEPTSGEAFINGRVASLLEVGTGFHPDLTGRENVYMNGTILGMKKREIATKFDEIVAFSELEQFIDTPVKRYSSGMYVRLAFAVAAHLEPEILLIDEVLAVGDMEFQKKCLGKMNEVANTGRTILFVSHNLAAIRTLCPRTLLLVQGETLGVLPTDQALERYAGGSGTGLSVLCPAWQRADVKDSDFAFRAVSIRQAGRVADTAMISLPLDISMELTAAAAREPCLVTLQVINEQGVIVHHSADLCEDDAQQRWRKGHRMATIPPHALAAGQYRLSLWLWNSRGILDQSHGILKWQVVPNTQLYVMFDPSHWKGTTGPGLMTWKCVARVSELEVP